MTDYKKWFDRWFGSGSYDGLVADVRADIERFPWEDDTEDFSSVDVQLRVYEGAFSYSIGDAQSITDHRGRWAFGSIEKGSTTEFIEFIVKDLIEELHDEFSDLEDWSLCDIPFLEESLDGRPYVIYVLTGKSIPTLEVEPLEDWNAEDALYVDADEEDFRCNPQFHITEPRTNLLDALTAYREHLKVQRLSYLLED